LDSDLITRGAGFGFMGSAVTSLIYSFDFLMFSAFEGSIIANTVHARFEIIPLWVLYAVIGLMFIPLTWYGLTAMNWIMWVTIPVFFVFLAWRIISVAASGDAIDFWGYQPTNSVDPVAGPPLLQLGATVLALITNAAICADIGRFIPPGQRRIGALALGFGFEAATFLGVTMLGAWFALKLGGQTDPGAYLPNGRYYVSPTAAGNVDPDLPRFGAGAETEVITASSEATTEPCVKCGKHFELAEFVRCPFHEGAICSVCCAAEPDCGELCKQQAPDEPTPVSIEDRRR
jgi:hypothetical protein